jgi:hypothetical protein
VLERSPDEMQGFIMTEPASTLAYRDMMLMLSEPESVSSVLRRALVGRRGRHAMPRKRWWPEPIYKDKTWLDVWLDKVGRWVVEGFIQAREREENLPRLFLWSL